MTYELSTIDIAPSSDNDTQVPFVCAIADDDQADVLLTKKALESSEMPFRLLWVKNGLDLVELLRNPPPKQTSISSCST